MKLTEEQINNIKKLKEENLSYAEIGRQLNIKRTLVLYHCLTPEKKQERLNKQKETLDKKTPEQKKEIYKKKYPYIKSYLKKRYKEDPEFRQKIRNRQKIHNAK